MNAERQRILEMVASGSITPEEAEQLLEAVRTPKQPIAKWLFQPLELLTTQKALLVAAAAASASVALGFFQIRYDGALDMHVAREPVAAGQSLIDLLLAWPFTALVFFAVARLVGRQGRYVDFLAAVGLARIPLVLAGLIGAATAEATLAAVEGRVSPAMLVSAMLMLPLVAWTIALLVTGMRTAAGLRGGRLALASVVAIVLAETLTKLALWGL